MTLFVKKSQSSSTVAASHVSESGSIDTSRRNLLLLLLLFVGISTVLQRACCRAARAAVCEFPGFSNLNKHLLSPAPLYAALTTYPQANSAFHHFGVDKY